MLAVRIGDVGCLTLALAPVLLGACASTPPAPPGGGPPPVAASAPATSAPPAKPPPFDRRATTKNAGGATCRADHFELGPADFIAGINTDVTTGFGPGGGLAAWKSARDKISFRTITPGGKPSGALQQASAAKNFTPRHVVAIDGGFVVVGDLYEWKHSRSAAYVLGAEGKPLGPATELDLEHRYIHDVSAPRGRSFVILATRALMVPDGQDDIPGRWLAVEASADGKIVQKSADLEFGHPMVRVLDAAFAIEIDGKAAWFIQRGGEAKGELVRDAKIERIARDKLGALGVKEESLEPPDGVDWMLDFGPSGSRFHRMADGKELGEPVTLPPGIGALASPQWSGVAFVIGHSTQTDSAATAWTVGIDCK